MRVAPQAFQQEYQQNLSATPTYGVSTPISQSTATPQAGVSVSANQQQPLPQQLSETEQLQRANQLLNQIVAGSAACKSSDRCSVSVYVASASDYRV